MIDECVRSRKDSNIFNSINQQYMKVNKDERKDETLHSIVVCRRHTSLKMTHIYRT
jgi:hypothetical protein